MKQKQSKGGVGTAFSKTLSMVLKIGALCLFSLLALQICGPLLVVAFVYATDLTITVIALVLLALFARVLFLLVRRRRFLRSLDRLCTAQGGALSLTGHPYLNIFFRVRAGAVMRYADHETVLYFLSCRRTLPLCLKADGSAVYFHRLRFINVQLFSWQHIWQFCDEPKKGSYLLLMPPPAKIWAGRVEPSCEADNGTSCGAYSIFAGNAFLRHAERMAEAEKQR